MATIAEQPLSLETAGGKPAADIVVRIADAKARLSELIQRAERGEHVVIARGNTPVIELTPIAKPKRTFGTLLRRVPGLDLEAVHAAAEEGWSEEELDEFEGDLENELS